jgi:hypothetical protein
LTLDNAIPVEVAEEEDTLLNETATKANTNSIKEKKQAHRNKCCLGIDVIDTNNGIFYSQRALLMLKTI